MAGWDFTADSSIQKTLAKTLNDGADKFDTKIGEMYSEIDSLSAHWVGEDYDTYKTGTEGYKTALQDLSNGIRMFGKHFEALSTGTEALASTLASTILNATSGPTSHGNGASPSSGTNQTNGDNLTSGGSNNQVNPGTEADAKEEPPSPNPTSNPILAELTTQNQNPGRQTSETNNQENSPKDDLALENNPLSVLLPSSNESEEPLDTNVSNLTTAKKDINVDNVPSGSRVASAIDTYSSELDSAEYAKVDENIFMTITPTEIEGNNCYLTHVVVNNPNQIFGEPANGQYASGLETATSAAKRLGTSTALVLNGSHFSYADGSEDLKGANQIVIVNGEIKTNGNAGGMEICLDKNGNLFNAPAGTSAKDLVDNGVVYTFSSHDSHLISDGNKTYEHQDEAYNSTVIGQKAPCDYYILTGPTSNFGAADYLYDKGCTFAKSMDQGGSVSLVYNGQLINTPTDESGERAIGDFLCISD